MSEVHSELEIKARGNHLLLARGRVMRPARGRTGNAKRPFAPVPTPHENRRQRRKRRGTALRSLRCLLLRKKIPMTPELNINLAGIPEERWTETEERCAECRQLFKDMVDPEAPDPDNFYSVPLLLWRKDGKEMLRLCWVCAHKRLKAGEILSGAE
jgi:hypothetical protein